MRWAGLNTIWFRIGHGEALARFTPPIPIGRVSNLRFSTQCLQNKAALDAKNSPTSSRSREPFLIELEGRTYQKDNWYNISPNILSSIPRRLHIQKDHPISITRAIIESRFPSPTYRHHNMLFPVVSTNQNFDSLGFPLDHPGRSKTDTYYVNSHTVLRTHTSAHQADIFKANESEGFLISADVYRRDAIDRSHYPVFHQMEGARMWTQEQVPQRDIAAAVWRDFETLPKHKIQVKDPNPTVHESNPLQEEHTREEVDAIAAHLKRSLELVVADIFHRAKIAARAAAVKVDDKPLRVRWVEAYFPFTSPSWEMEVFWQGDWLEILGCGVVRQDILTRAGVPTQRGWAFGLGLERIAMLLFDIPDIRLFWSQDERFLSQFRRLSEGLHLDSGGILRRFVPFSKYPACYKDVAFWLGSTSSAVDGGGTANSHDLHENDVMEVVRDICGDEVEDVKCVDSFTHPQTGRKSFCYRINYRSLERTLTNECANDYHEKVRRSLVERLGVELR